jgi:MFS family permease
MWAALALATAMTSIWPAACWARADDQPGESPDDYDDADDAFLGGPDPPCFFPLGVLILLVIVAIFVAAAVLGVVAAAAAVVVTAVLAAVGVVSLSAIVGFVSRRPGHALRALFIQLGAMGGAVAGAAFLYAAARLGEVPLNLALVFVLGGAAGAAAGAGVGILFNLAWTYAAQWMTRRLRPAPREGR